MTPKEAYNILKKDFSIQELQELAYSIDIPYEDLGGTGRSGKALAMVQYSERHGIFAKLVQGMTEVRDEKNKAGTKKPDSPETKSGDTYIVKGDLIQGEKNTGDKISVDTISGGSNIALGKNAAVSTDTSNTYNMSGNFSGAILNINSSLENVTQTIGTLPHANEEAKAELQQLVTQLQETLQQVPPDKEEDAEAVAELTKMLLNTANKEKPNKQFLQITGDGLKQAAENLAAIVPDVVKIAGAIVAGVLAL